MTGPAPERFEDLDALVAMAITAEDVREPFRGVDEIAVRAIVALSHAGAALADYRRLFPGVSIGPAEPREVARELISELIAYRKGDLG